MQRSVKSSLLRLAAVVLGVFAQRLSLNPLTFCFHTSRQADPILLLARQHVHLVPSGSFAHSGLLLERSAM